MNLNELLPALPENMRWKFAPDHMIDSPRLYLQTRRWWGWSTIDAFFVTDVGRGIEWSLKIAASEIIRRERNKINALTYYGATKS